MIATTEVAPRRRVAFDDLAGWAACDLSSVWPAIHSSARATVDRASSLRPAQALGAAQVALSRLMVTLPADLASDEARSFIEQHCEPWSIEERGFATGYYEPLVEASPVRSAEFGAPILPRPTDLVTFAQGQTERGVPPGLAAARLRDDGTLEAYPDRATIEAGAVEADAEPLVWLQDWTEVFLIQVQGSARVRLPDGAHRRLVYAGRNGHPYTSVGRLLIDRGQMCEADMSLESLKAWLRSNGQATGEAGRALMQENRSYIFFALEPDDGRSGPTGGAGLPLTAGVSIAVDRAIWPYGLPVFIASDTPVAGFGPEPLARLFVAQDTGSAIVGPARVDLFTGSGEAAGHHAGTIRHAIRMSVLLPRS